MYSEQDKAKVMVNGIPFHTVFDAMTAQNLLDFHKQTMPHNAPSHIYNLTDELSGIMTSHFEPRRVNETVQEYAQRLLDLGVDADCPLGRFLKGFPLKTMNVAEVAAFVVPDMVVITSYGEEMVDTEPVRPLFAYKPFRLSDLSVTVMTRDEWHASKVQKQVEKQEQRVVAAEPAPPAAAEPALPAGGQVQQGEKRSREDFEQQEEKVHQEDAIIINDDEEEEQAAPAAEEHIVPETTTKRGRKQPQFDWLKQYGIDKKAFTNYNMTYSTKKCSDTGAILMTTHLAQRETIVNLFPNGHVSEVHHAHEGSRFYVFVNFSGRTERSNAMNVYKEIVNVRGDKPRTNANMVLFIKSLAPRLSETERNGFLEILESKVVQPIEPVFRLQEQEERPQFPLPPFEFVAMQFPPASVPETDSFPVVPAREFVGAEFTPAPLESLGFESD